MAADLPGHGYNMCPKIWLLTHTTKASLWQQIAMEMPAFFIVKSKFKGEPNQNLEMLSLQQTFAVFEN